jgi:hypothetical protein
MNTEKDAGGTELKMQMNQRGLGRLWGMARSSLGVALAALGLIGVVGACSGDDEPTEPREPPPPTGAVSVEVTYPNATAASVTAVLHAWVLAEREGAEVSEERATFTCASLIGGSLDPYDLTLVRLADVATTEDVTRITAEHVAPGAALVYVEAGGFDGQAEFAGCGTTSVAGAPVAVALELSRAKIFDCANPETEDGSPCDDGQLCTVGETCDDGVCGDGAARDCGFAADGCNAGSCDEADGCVIQPLANGTACDDGLFCTATDSCVDGQCIGSSSDCATEVGTCQVVVGCNEETNQCITASAPYGTTCDDGLFCTLQDQCDSFGTCFGTTRDCTSEASQCETAFGCDESADACITTPDTAGTFCDDGLFCTVNETCDGLGACAGGAARDCSGFALECEVASCDETLDTCAVADAPAGTSCDDGSFCSDGDECDGFGLCTSGSTEPDCSSFDDECNVGICGSLSDACEADPLPQGTACDDGDELTTDDECDGLGTCAGL